MNTTQKLIYISFIFWIILNAFAAIYILWKLFKYFRKN